MNSLPSGTVTFLFTDIEGSTKLAQSHRDKWESLRARHHTILRSAMDVHNGYVFQIIGDAFCVAFHTAGDALRAAVKSQTDLYNEDWNDTPIKVRMGINTGTAQVSENTDHSVDYKGYTSMARVQRLMSAAHGGQTLISLATEELVRDEMPENISLRDMGERRLKDLIRPEHIYQLVIPNLPIDFPPLKTLDAYRHNLPIQMTSFIGREKEIAEIAQAIREHRLVTLTGIGGTGKTRLSLQASADLIDEFPDGIWFIQLAPISDASLIPQAVASVWNVHEQSGRALSELLIEYVRTKHLLLVLDNCEHVAEASARFTDELLHNAPNLKILATSRVTLNLAGEMTYPVNPLALPDPQKLIPLTALTQYEAVRLFIERAITVRPIFSVTNANAPAVAQICQHLDGIPLAIELAAARMRALSPDEIAARLGDRFNLLTGGSRTALPRQQTLRATMDWSYDLLPDRERMLLNQLSVFTGNFSLEAVESVFIGKNETKTNTLDLLTALVDNSLVLVEEGNIETRYRLLETVRQYALEKLAESGEVDTVRDRHLDYFLKLTETAEPKLRSAQQLIWLNRLETEHDNLREALEWSLGREDAEVCLRFTGAGWFFWGMRGYRQEGSRFLKAALEKPGAEKRGAARGKALTGLSYMARYLGDLVGSQNAAQEAVAIWREVGDNWWLAFTLGRFGANILIQGDLIEARRIQEEAVKFARRAEDKWALGDALGNLGRALNDSGDYQAARSAQEEGLAVYRGVGDKSCIAEALQELGALAHIEGNGEQAKLLYKESLEIYRELHYVGGLLSLLFESGCMVQGQGDNEQAAKLFIEALVLAQEAGDKDISGRALAGLGGVAGARGRPEQAALLLGASESIFNAIGLDILLLFLHRLVDYNRWVANIRSQLDEATFKAAWAKGRAMTLEQAVALALEQNP